MYELCASAKSCVEEVKFQTANYSSLFYLDFDLKRLIDEYINSMETFYM